MTERTLEFTVRVVVVGDTLAGMTPREIVQGMSLHLFHYANYQPAWIRRWESTAAAWTDDPASAWKREGGAWQPMSVAYPEQGEFIVEIKQGFSTGCMVVHFAHSDGDGEQPPFGPGLFYYCGSGFTELRATPLRWRHIAALAQPERTAP